MIFMLILRYAMPLVCCHAIDSHEHCRHSVRRATFADAIRHAADAIRCHDAAFRASYAMICHAIITRRYAYLR